MQQLDERILEHLSENPYASPRFMANQKEFSASKERIRERCRILARVGLVEPESNDWRAYHLTEKGERYLNGELKQDAFPDPWADGKTPYVWWLTPS